MAPFDSRNGHRYILIKPDLVVRGNQITNDIVSQVEELDARPQFDWNGAFPVVTGRNRYMEQVEAIKSSISTGAFQKAVLSRIGVIKGQYLELVPKLFQTICRRHPNAFVYLFKSEDQFWLGASPEPLIRLQDGHISTVSKNLRSLFLSSLL